MAELINLTPHPIRIYSAETPDRVSDVTDGLLATIPASGTVARVAEYDLGTTEHIPFETYADGATRIPVELVQFSSVHGLPASKPGVYLIVPLVTALSAFAAAHRQGEGRDDLLVPYAQVRNGDNAVVGCRLLARPC